MCVDPVQSSSSTPLNSDSWEALASTQRQPILSAIAGGGQPRSNAPADVGPVGAVEAFIEQVARLGGPELLAVAEARREIDESDHATSLQAAAEALARSGRADRYVEARRRLALAHLRALSRGDDPGPTSAEDARSNEAARLLQLAFDDAVLALLTSDGMHPKHLRELYRPWHAVLVEPADRPRPQD